MAVVTTYHCQAVGHQGSRLIGRGDAFTLGDEVRTMHGDKLITSEVTKTICAVCVARAREMERPEFDRYVPRKTKCKAPFHKGRRRINRKGDACRHRWRLRPVFRDGAAAVQDFVVTLEPWCLTCALILRNSRRGISPDQGMLI